MLLSIIIVNWNAREYLGKCLESVYNEAETLRDDVEVIVVDNCSSDGSAAWLGEKWPRVKLIASEKNYGFSKANNMAMEVAEGEYFLILNPDTELHKNSLEKPIHFLETHPDYGCVGIKSVRSNGRVLGDCARRNPTVWRILCNQLMLDKLIPVPLFGGTDMPYWDHNDSREIEIIGGAFMLFRRNVYQKIGGFDTRIPMFLDDVELCLRMQQNKVPIWYMADVSFTHFVGKSRGKAQLDWVVRMGLEAGYYSLQAACGELIPKRYVLLLIFFLPLKVLLLPVLAFGKYIKNRDVILPGALFECWVGWNWALKKRAHADQIHCPVNELPNHVKK